MPRDDVAMHRTDEHPAVTQGQRILLIGMMGSGKTTVGRALEHRTGWPFRDNDALVRELTGREPADIDAEDGEDALHAAEIAAFDAGAKSPGPAVIAVAAAVADDPEARRRLAASGHVVWLSAPPEVLRARIGSGAGRRADAVDLEWLRARAAEREPIYREVADQIVDVEALDPSAAADAIARAVTDPVDPASAG